MLRVGLTGGIASGKSTVGHCFAELGAFVLDADEITRWIMAPGGTAFEPVVSAFGREILDESGRIDRRRLGAVIFADPEKRETLNALVHPRVRDEVLRRNALSAQLSGTRIAVFDAALLVETGAHRDYHRLVVVHCSPETQLRRVQQRDGLDAEQSAARLAAQAPVADKLAAADYTIDTDGELAATLDQARQVFARLLGDFGDLAD